MFNQDSNTYRFFDKKLKMMFEKPEPWQGTDIGKADACLRTSMSYMAYGDEILKEGVLSCFTKIQDGDKYYYQGSRCYPRFGEEDMSRDQTIIALASLKFNNVKELNDIGLHLRFRLSKRFIMTPALWIWIRMLCKGGIYKTLFGLMELIELLPSVLWNKFIRWCLGYDKQYDMDWYCDVDPNTGLWHNWDGKGWVYDEKSDQNNGYKLYNLHMKRLDEHLLVKLFDGTEFPEYAAHLASWMIYFMKDGFLKKILKKIIIWDVEKQNYLLRMLMDVDVDKSVIDNYKSKWTFRWSNRFNGTCYTYNLKDESSVYNVIDKDILYSVKKRM